MQTDINAQLDKISIKKLDALQKRTRHIGTEKETMKHTFHARLANFTRVKFSNDQINKLNLGFDYAIERNPPKKEL